MSRKHDYGSAVQPSRHYYRRGTRDWPLTKPSFSEPELAADWMRRIPQRRNGTPEDSVKRDE